MSSSPVLLLVITLHLSPRGVSGCCWKIKTDALSQLLGGQPVILSFPLLLTHVALPVIPIGSPRFSAFVNAQLPSGKVSYTYPHPPTPRVSMA